MTPIAPVVLCFCLSLILGLMYVFDRPFWTYRIDNGPDGKTLFTKVFPRGNVATFINEEGEQEALFKTLPELSNFLPIDQRKRWNSLNRLSYQVLVALQVVTWSLMSIVYGAEAHGQPIKEINLLADCKSWQEGFAYGSLVVITVCAAVQTRYWWLIFRIKLGAVRAENYH